jgi:hypothetical protein
MVFPLTWGCCKQEDCCCTAAGTGVVVTVIVTLGQVWLVGFLPASPTHISSHFFSIF